MKIENPEYKYNSVLLIDDSDLDNFINEKMLESNNFSKSIHVSTNGKVALDFVTHHISPDGVNKETYPDVMFVDLNMPVMNGFEFIENLKKIDADKLSKCKIVILTSSIHREDRLKAEKIDKSILFVNKPLTNELLKTL